MAVQNTFATKTGTIPLSELDENFATPIIIGSTPIALGSTITSIEGLTLVTPTLVTPLLGTPASGTLTNCTFPTLNQSTTGNAANVTGVVAVENGGTGTTTPSLVPGTNVTITGTWPNQTIDSSGGGSGMTYPSAGIAKSTGSAWETSYSTTGTGTALVLSTSPTLAAPALGTPTSGTLTNCTLPQLSASTGSALVGTIQSGTSPVLRTVASKLNDTVSVKDFGAVGNGANDDTLAIQNAINYTGSRLGGTILLPAGSYKITSTLSCLYPNILFVGDGSDEPHDKAGVSQGAKAATKLVWAGESGGTMLNIGSVNGVDNIKYSGGGVRSIYFDSGCTGTNLTGASYGIELVSYNAGVFENVMFREFQDYGIRIGCVTQLWDARDPQHNRFINCWSRNFINKSGGLFLLEGDTAMFSSVAATALVVGRTYVIVSPGDTNFTLVGAANNTIGTSFVALSVGTGTGMVVGLGGTYTLANVSLNHFENCGAQFYNGIAFNIKNSDHNFFINCRANRISSGTGQGIVFQGSNQRNTGADQGSLTSDLAFVARKNVFFGFSGGNTIVAKGTTITATVTMTIATPAVVTWTAHGLAANKAITFSTTGILPAGLTANTTYYVLAPTTDTFTVSATVGGAAIITTGTQSGVHSCAATVTMTIATPAVVTWTAHGFVTDSAISFTTTGALPAGLTAGTTYYVLAPTTDTFTVSETVGGTAIITTGTQSGVHSCTTPSYLYPSYKNIFTMMDDSNNTPFPTIETDALCYVTMRTDGVGYYPNQVSGVFSYAATIDNASDMALQARSRVGTESLRLENRSSNGLRIARPAVDNLTIEGEWSLAVIGATVSAGENLKVSRITGTGCLEVSSIAQNSVTITAATTTLTNTNAIVLVNAASGSCVITLPLAASYGTSVSPAIRIRRIDSSGNTVTVQRQGTTDMLNGGTIETLAAVTGKTYICNGTANWYSL